MQIAILHWQYFTITAPDEPKRRKFDSNKDEAEIEFYEPLISPFVKQAVLLETII